MTQADAPDITTKVVGILGGTGPQGRGLARQFARAGVTVLLGSRSAERAEETAQNLREATRGKVTGHDNAAVASSADIVVVAVPWDGHAELLAGLQEQLAGKIVIDCVNPLGFDSHGAFALPVEEGSAAMQARTLLPESIVTAAFHHLSAVRLEDDEVTSFDEDVLVLGDDREATDLVQALAATLPGVRGVYAGRLRNAHQVEAFTANLISINRRYKAHAGITVTGI